MNLAVQRGLVQKRNQIAGPRLPSKRHNIARPISGLPVSSSRSSGSFPKMDRQGLLLLHLPQVRLVAKGIWDRMRFAVELDDLVGFGMIGLLHAVERFDPDRGILLKTYAEHRIRGAILDGLRGMDWLPRSARQKERQQREQPPEEEAGGCSPALKPKPEACRQADKASTKSVKRPKPYHLPQMKSVFSGGNLDDLEKLAESFNARHAPCGRGANPEGLYERKEKSDQLAAAISRLPRRHQQILDLYYQHELSMRQIGAILQVHESRVSQLHAAALTRLRRDLSGRGDASFSPRRKPPQRYPATLGGPDSSSRLTAAQSSSVSTPMVSRAVSIT